MAIAPALHEGFPESDPEAEEVKDPARDKLLAKFPEGGKYLDEFRGLHPEHFAVIKVGGSIIADDELLGQTADDLVHLQELGLPPIVVYGGGDQIKEALERRGPGTQEAENGTRITRPEHMPAVVEGLAVAGWALQKAIIDRGGRAMRINSRMQAILPDTENLGSATRAVLTRSKRRLVEQVIRDGYIGLLNPIGRLAVGEKSEINLNADPVAAGAGKAMPVRKLILLTEEGGINGDDGTRIRRLYADDAAELVDRRVISGGAVVKAMSALDAKGGVHDVVITSPAELFTELFTEDGAGTIIRVRD